jgi:hypothetical protein
VELDWEEGISWHQVNFWDPNDGTGKWSKLRSITEVVSGAGAFFLIQWASMHVAQHMKHLFLPVHPSVCFSFIPDSASVPQPLNQQPPGPSILPPPSHLLQTSAAKLGNLPWKLNTYFSSLIHTMP